MMTRSSGGRVLAALLLAAILMAGAVGLYRAGWSQGYWAGGLVAAAGDGAAAPRGPYLYPGYGWGGAGPSFGPPMGFFFGPWVCLIGFALFFLLGGFFRFWGHGAWRGGPHAWEGPHGRHWHTHPHSHEPAENHESSDSQEQPRDEAEQ